MKQNIKQWLYRRSSIKILAISVLVLVVLVALFVDLYPHFAIEQLFGFYALYGFLSCIALVLIAKAIGFLIKKKEDYYDL